VNPKLANEIRIILIRRKKKKVRYQPEKDSSISTVYPHLIFTCYQTDVQGWHVVSILMAAMMCPSLYLCES